MCRYAFKLYKERYACFNCRKSFRVPLPEGIHTTLDAAQAPDRAHLCPECKQPMHRMGKDFKPPKHQHIKQWEKVRLLHLKGVRWGGCGCGPGHNFKTLREARAYTPQSTKPSRKG